MLITPSHLHNQSGPIPILPLRERPSAMKPFLAAGLAATLLLGACSGAEAPPAPQPVWREEMDRLAGIAHRAYVGVVREDPEFVPYFRAVTPEGALGRLPLGSRPAKRRQEGGIETLRAIPWIFAWTQTRLMLPAWLGSGEAFSQRLEEDGGLDRLREMREQWPFFGTYLDMLEMLLAKSDPLIAAYYEKRLVDDPALTQLGESLRQRLSAIGDSLGELGGSLYEIEAAWRERPEETVLHFLGAWRVDELFHDLIFHPALTVPAADLLDVRRLRFWHDQVFYKPARHRGVVPWHQDYSYWSRTSPACHVTVNIALDGYDAHNGALQYVPGSHKWELLSRVPFDGDLEGALRVLDLPVPGGPPGILMDPCTNLQARCTCWCEARC